MITCQPPLRDPISPVLNDVAVIADEEEGAAVAEVELQGDETVRVAGEVVQRDALTEIDGLVGKSFPV